MPMACGNHRTFEWRGAMSAALILPALLLCAVSRPRVLEGTWLDEAFDAAAWIALGIGALLRLWATLYIGGRKSTELVARGPYAMCRHPLYVGSFVISIALTLYLKNVTVMTAVLLAAVWHTLVVIPSEEAHLRKHLGETYESYCRATPRFVPQFARLDRPGIVEVKVAAFLRECARTLGFILVAIALELFAHARTEPWWPRLLNLP